VSLSCFSVVVCDLISAQTLDPTSASCDGGFGGLDSGCADGSPTWCAWSSNFVCANPGSASSCDGCVVLLLQPMNDPTHWYQHHVYDAHDDQTPVCETAGIEFVVLHEYSVQGLCGCVNGEILVVSQESK